VDKYPWPIKYVATYHPEDIPGIQERRRQSGGNTDYKIISHLPKEGVDICIPEYWAPSGSSSLLGAQAGLEMGYDRIVLCGCPLTGNAPGGNPYEAFRPGWESRKETLLGKVKSMSGWTRELLGAPDEQWLSSGQSRHSRITIGANWDGGDYYPIEYVNKLYRACLRNTTIPFDFVLYIGPLAEKPGRLDGLDPAIKPVCVGLPSWWSGMPFWAFFPPFIDTPTILYLDIDQVIVGSLDDLILYPSDHAMMKDWPARICPAGREKDGCVSTTLIRNRAGRKVWEAYEAAGKPAWDVLTEQGPLPMAAQGIINDPAQGIPHDLFPENWVCSYKLEVRERGLPEDCRIVAFHGRPKQHEVEAVEPWIREHWR
jgi:hypothetical protein